MSMDGGKEAQIWGGTKIMGGLASLWRSRKMTTNAKMFNERKHSGT